MAIAEHTETGPRVGELKLPQLPARLDQIDILKGLAILSVLALHTLTGAQLEDVEARFWIGQAVPVFVVLMGLNATASMWRQGRASVPGLYSRAYILGRLDRIYVPFLVVFAVSSLLALAQGTLTARGLAGGLVTGALPYSGPGNYFITFVFQFAAGFPIFYWCYRRAPRTVLVLSFVLGAAWEFTAPHVGWLDAHTSVYAGLFVRFLPFIALGAAMGERMLHGRGTPRWWWLGACVGSAYLVALSVDADVIVISQVGRRALGQTVLVSFYTAMLVAVGLHWLPGESSARLWRLIAALGIASYEIFLLQIIWFTLASGQRLEMFVPSLVVCCGAGYLLHLALRRVPRLVERFAA